MRKILMIAAVVVLAAALSGCASIVKAGGGVTKAELGARDAMVDQKLESLTADIARLTKGIEAAKAESASGDKAQDANLEKMRAELAGVRDDIIALSKKVDDQTSQALLKLAAIIQQALAREGATPVAPVVPVVPAPASAPAPAPAAPGSDAPVPATDAPATSGSSGG